MNESAGGNDILVVVSKLKNYIRGRAGFNTSGSVAPAMSNIIRHYCDLAIENARKEGRKTVMDRDIPSPGSV
jgi:histone H3/H4